MDIDIKQYIKDIKILRAQADQYDGNAPGADIMKIELLTKAHMLMGRVATVREGSIGGYTHFGNPPMLAPRWNQAPEIRKHALK